MKNTLIGFGLAAVACGAALAQTTSPVANAVRRALEVNPEVASKFSILRAAVHEVDVTAGTFLPRVDASAEGGARSYENTQFKPYDHELKRGQVDLAITQLLWDGFATRNEVRRLDHARLLRYFEFLDAAEQTGMAAAQAYYDVVRYRKLVVLAEDNYVQHKLSFEQVQSRVKAGVGRGVDLEQVVARVALAESNLVTERANLHDVTERYRRIVGELPPPDNVTAVSMTRPLPATASSAMETATTQSPAIAASIENLRSARAAAAARKGAYQPTVQARLRGGWGHNYDGSLYQKRDATAELVLNWNLFNGGSDVARERQYAALLTESENLRDKACDDVRQTTAIAFNDVRKLGEQLGYLDRNVVSIEKARDAYRQQFDIGQRSLLDLLNAENELYTAKRAYVMAEEDLATAVVRTYAAMGSLVAGLGLQRPDAGNAAEGADHWSRDGDGSARCPVTATEVAGASFDQLDTRAHALAATRVLPSAAPASAATATPVPASAPTGPSAQQRASATIAVQRLQDWAAAWTAKDYPMYMSFYGDEFKPLKTPRARWTAERRRLVTKKGAISVTLENIRTQPVTETRVETSFDQVYVSPDFKDTMHKTLVWDRVGSEWRIVGETNR
jgi:adhesin transport system outer membrane protein